MYFAIVAALMFVLPVASIIIEWFAAGQSGDLFFLIGKWFVFWAVGVRLFMAGLRQTANPSFTAETIFETTDSGAKKVVSELGIANISMGAVGLLSLYFQAWTLPVAVCGALFFGLAGIKHLLNTGRNLIENVATLSDLWAALVLIVYIVSVALHA